MGASRLTHRQPEQVPLPRVRIPALVRTHRRTHGRLECRAQGTGSKGRGDRAAVPDRALPQPQSLRAGRARRALPPKNTEEKTHGQTDGQTETQTGRSPGNTRVSPARAAAGGPRAQPRATAAQERPKPPPALRPPSLKKKINQPPKTNTTKEKKTTPQTYKIKALKRRRGNF